MIMVLCTAYITEPPLLSWYPHAHNLLVTHTRAVLVRANAFLVVSLSYMNQYPMEAATKKKTETS
ncbi:hypothetical protein PI125_g13970 [Phytophthora idaei]|nr:hypothetical protein PI125_g13970 [Phytophthora idaei]